MERSGTGLSQIDWFGDRPPTLGRGDTVSDFGTDRVSSLLGDSYSEVRRISREGMSPVYSAIDNATRRRVAIKVLARPIDEEQWELPSELLVQSELSWHPNILTLHTALEGPDRSLLIVLEFADNGSLADVVDRGEPIDHDSLLDIGIGLASALSAAHEAGFIHCDIKPSNVLLARDNSVRLADFGLSRPSENTLDTMESIRGSLRFVAPEVLDGTPVSPSSDVHALALTLHALAHGKNPFGEPGQPQASIISRIHTEKIRFGPCSSLPDELTTLLNDALNKDPHRRPSAATLETALRRARTLSAESPTDPSAHERHWLARGRNLALVAIVVVAATLGALLSTAATNRTSPEALSAPVEPPSFCEAFADSTNAREQLFNRISSDLEQSLSPSEVIERLIVTYPLEFGELMGPLITAYEGDGANGVTFPLGREQISQLGLADALNSLAGGKSFLFDGESGEFNPQNLPGELRSSARQISDLYSDARRRCPEVKVALAAPKARMSSAILSNLTNKSFMDGFFSDPASFELIDAQTVALMLSTSKSFLIVLFDGHLDWFVQLLDNNPDIRSEVTYDHPDLVLMAMAREPTTASTINTSEWRHDLSLGLVRLDEVSRIGMESLYGPQLRVLEAEIP